MKATFKSSFSRRQYGKQSRFGRFACVVSTFLLCVTVFGTTVMIGAGPAWAQAIVIVRSAEVADASQLTFFVPANVGVSEQRDGDQFNIVFTAPMDFDFGPFRTTPLRFVAAPGYSQTDSETTVSLTLTNGASAELSRTGRRLVLRAAVPEVAAPTPAETAAAQAQEQAAQQQATEQAAADQLNTVPGLADFVAEEQATATVAQNAAANQNTSAAESSDEQADSPTRNLESGAASGPLLTVSMEAGADGAQHIHFEWRYRVSSAVFSRGGYLWVIFDEEAEPDLAALQPFLNDRITTAEQARDRDQTLFRFTLNDEQGVVVSAEDNRWTVSLMDEEQTPSNPITMARQDVESDNFRLFIPIENPGPHLRIMDPLVGDVLDVIPILAPGSGASRERVFAQFSLLPSAQGLVLTRNSDQLVVSRFSNGVAVGGVTNLAISNSPLDTDIALRRLQAQGALRPARLIDFEVWRLGPLDDFNDNRTRLLGAISQAEGDEINERRWDLARFFLGHGLASEAMAVLSLMAEASPEIMTDPKYRAVRGIGAYYLRDYVEAQRQLGARELDVEPGIYLWRSLVAETIGEYENSIKLFERGRESIDQYEPKQIAAFRSAVVRAALAVERFDTANWQLSLLRRMELDPYSLADVDYLEGRLLQLLGEGEEAKTYFLGIDEFINRRAAAHARYAMALAQLESGDIDNDQAIEEMERLRYSWRGDKFEQELLHGLGQMYMAKDDYRHGLETLRQAVASFEESAATRAMTQEMVTAFHRLFLEGEADKLPPVQALGLYYDFRELTPLGAEGDQMIRRLADRLVGVDLLDRAAELLNHQVRFRLEGSAQALIASRLAKIYLLDHRSEDALEILRATRQASMPADVAEDRRLVEARVLVELGRYDEAEILIEAQTSPEAMAIRADLFWGAGNWPEVASSTATILNERWRDTSQPLNNEERQYLIRHVIALSLDDQRAQLDLVKARYADLMQDGLLANAFDVITSPENYTNDELRDVVRRTAAVDTLQSFMDSYRQEFINRLPASPESSQ